MDNDKNTQNKGKNKNKNKDKGTAMDISDASGGYGSFSEQARNAYQNADVDQSRLVHEKKLEDARKKKQLQQQQQQQQKLNGGSDPRNGLGSGIGMNRRGDELGDVDVSSTDELIQIQKAEEGHRSDGGVLKSIIYGGLDGILTAFALISGAAGGHMKPEVILVMGFSNVMADAIAMGVGDSISSISYHEYVKREARREEWEFDNFPEGEIEEMVDLYVERGLPRDDAEVLVTTMAKYRDFFISVMLVEELKLQIPGEDESPYKDGFITFTSFFVLGMMPILAFAIFPYLYPEMEPETLTSIATVVTLLVLFILGIFKAKFSLMSWWRSGIEFVFLGGAVALTSYLIGILVSELVVKLTGDTDVKLPGEPV